ncbi:Serine threonine-kinase [Cordyceps militaris]|uniref:Serine threonine-kinase n=1 Tax=Cordyceps militaris TaxID=73501 RepID=A0A2H4SK01_CORMI|nr:Serine threonine-kinase [Cordyceps militaris]
MEPHVLFDIHSYHIFTEYPENAQFFSAQPPICRFDPHEGISYLPAQDARDITPVPEMRPAPFLRVTLDDRPKYPSKGWVFGSDREACDMLIGKHGEGISGTQFSISPQIDTGRLILRNLSRNGTYVEEETEGEVEYIMMTRQRGISDTQSLVIVVGGNTRLRIALSGQSGSSYARDWAKLYTDMNQNGPTLETLQTIPKTASTHISPYTLKYLVASQPLFTLFSAIEKRSNRPVIVKRYSSRRRDQADREASLLSSIQHDHIISFHNYDREYGLVFAHCGGRLLCDEHKRNPLTYGEFKSMLWQIVDALQYLHGLFLYHGDIRPESVIIRRRLPAIDIALLNFDMSSRQTTRESLIRWEMDNLFECSLQFLCGVQSFSEIHPHIRNASVRQMLSAFPTARYEAIASNSTHAAALLRDPDFCSVLSDESPENALTLPLSTATHPVPSFDQTSLPDTEPCGLVEEENAFFYLQDKCQVTIRKTHEKYEVILTEILLAARLPLGRCAALIREYTGVRSQLRTVFKESHWIPLSKGVAITQSLDMSVPEALRHASSLTSD